jgi:hypothetical protein
VVVGTGGNPRLAELLACRTSSGKTVEESALDLELRQDFSEFWL